MATTPLDTFDLKSYCIDQHYLHHLRQQSRLEFFHWKVMFAFLLYVLVMLILSGKGILSSSSTPIAIFGVGCLVVYCLLHQLDLQNKRCLTQCLRLGTTFEDQTKSQCEGDTNLAKGYSARQRNSVILFRAHLISCLFPVSLVALITSIAIASLATTVDSWLFLPVLGGCILILVSWWLRLLSTDDSLTETS